LISWCTGTVSVIMPYWAHCRTPSYSCEQLDISKAIKDLIRAKQSLLFSVTHYTLYVTCRGMFIYHFSLNLSIIMFYFFAICLQYMGAVFCHLTVYPAVWIMCMQHFLGYNCWLLHLVQLKIYLFLSEWNKSVQLIWVRLVLFVPLVEWAQCYLQNTACCYVHRRRNFGACGMASICPTRILWLQNKCEALIFQLNVQHCHKFTLIEFANKSVCTVQSTTFTASSFLLLICWLYCKLCSEALSCWTIKNSSHTLFSSFRRLWLCEVSCVL